MITPAFAQSVPTPSFSVNYVDSNPTRIVLTIQNIPFTQYIGSVDQYQNQYIKLYFNIRVKQSEVDWINLTNANDGFPEQPNGTENTVITFNFVQGLGWYVVDTNLPGLMSSNAEFSAPPGSQTDFQLQTMIGTRHRIYNSSNPMLPYPWVFTGNTSDWSTIQTLTVPEASPSPTLEPTPTPTPTPTLTHAPTPTPTITGSFTENNATLLNAIIIVAVIAIIAGLLVYFKKRKH
jgi:hypothetical protein